MKIKYQIEAQRKVMNYSYPEYVQSGENIEKKIYVLRCSLAIESIVTKLIISLLNIDDQEKALALGNRSTAISFDAKINLIHDLGYLESDELNKVIKPVMKIRNKFLHDINVTSFITATNKDLRKELLSGFKKYKEEDLEEKLHEGYDLLVRRTFLIINQRIVAIQNKAMSRMEFMRPIIVHGSSLLNHYRTTSNSLHDIIKGMLNEGRISKDVHIELYDFIGTKYNSYLESEAFEDYHTLVSDSDFSKQIQNIVIGKA